MRRSIALLCLTLAGCTTQLPPPTLPLVATPAESRAEAPPAPRVRPPELPTGRAFQVEGGAALWVAEVPAAERIRLLLVSRRGDDGAHVRGLTSWVAHYLAHQVAHGIDRVSPGRRAAGYHGDADSRGVHVMVDVEPAQLDVALVALREIVTRRPIDAEELLKHRDRTLERLEEASSFSRVMVAGLAQLHEHDISVEDAHHAELARYRSFDRAAAESVRVERFAASESVLVVVGPVQPPDVWSRFRSVFGDWHGAQPRRAAPPVAERPTTRAAVSAHEPGAAELAMLLARRAPALESPDRPAFEVLTAMTGGAMSSRLMTSLRERERLTYGAHASIDATTYGPVLFVSARFAPDEASQGIERLFGEMRRLRSEEAQQREIDGAVRRIWAHLRHSIEELGVAGFLERAWKAGVPPAELLGRYVALAELRPAQLLEVARRTLDPSRGLVLVMGDLDDVGGMWVVRTADGFALRDRPD